MDRRRRGEFAIMHQSAKPTHTTDQYSVLSTPDIDRLMYGIARLHALVVTAFVLMFYLPSMHAAAADVRFSLDLRTVDIHALIEKVSEKTGKNFIVDPRVRATVTVISSGSANAEELYQLFLSVLDIHGFAAVTAGEYVKIVPTQVGVQSPLPVLPEQRNDLEHSVAEHHSVAQEELITEVVAVQHSAAAELAVALRPLIPETATINAAANSNTIVVTDSADNIARIIEIIQLLDVPN